MAKRNHQPPLQLATNQQQLAAAFAIIHIYLNPEYQPFAKCTVSNRPTQINKKGQSRVRETGPNP